MLSDSGSVDPDKQAQRCPGCRGLAAATAMCVVGFSGGDRGMLGFGGRVWAGGEGGRVWEGASWGTKRCATEGGAHRDAVESGWRHGGAARFRGGPEQEGQRAVVRSEAFDSMIG